MTALLLVLALTGAQPATADHVSQLVDAASPADVGTAPAGGSPVAPAGAHSYAQTLPAKPGEVPVERQVYDALAALGRAHAYDCIAGIYAAESSWNPNAIGDRDRGGSYGLPQRHAPVWGHPPDPWPIVDQVAWTVAYADERYGGLCEAWASHQRKGWW